MMIGLEEAEGVVTAPVGFLWGDLLTFCMQSPCSGRTVEPTTVFVQTGGRKTHTHTHTHVKFPR